MTSCQQSVLSYSQKMLPKEELDTIEKKFIFDLENRFRGDSWDPEEVRSAIEKGKKELEQAISALRKENHKKCVENCEFVWDHLYQKGR